MKTGEGLGMADKGMEEGQDIRIAAVQEKVLGLVTDPAVGRTELGGQFGGGQWGESGDGAGTLVGREDAVDTTAILAGAVVGE
jgi:hypothetical protein